jgi:NTE family protein
MISTDNTIGLSLSGGGYRATAFHLGTLNKLQQMGVLPNVNILSTISGGSITGAYYCLNKDDYALFSKNLYEAVRHKNVVKKVLLSGTFLQLILIALIFLGPAFYFLFSSYAWLFPVLLAAFVFVLLKFQFTIFPVSKRIEDIYNQFFYNNKTLGNLPEHPKLVIGSTNLQTNRPFTFSKNWMQDSTYQYRKPSIEFKAENFPIARAVMASSCVPFAFTPIKIDKQFFKNETDASIVHPLLVDGGVYDNQGIHRIIQAGKYNCTGEITVKNTVSLLINTVDTFMSRIKKAQMVQDVYDNADNAKKQVAYFSLAWDVEKLIPGFVNNLADKQITTSVITALQLKEEWVADAKKYEKEIIDYLEEKTGYAAIIKPTIEEKKIARNVGTNLTALSKQQVDCLIKQAECLAELQVKLYCPSLIP